MIVLFGMNLSGVLLDSFLGTKGTFSTIFTAAGGIAAVGLYFGRFWKGG